MIEQREMIASLITMYCSFVFIYEEETSLETEILIFGIIVIVNLYFFSGWFYLFYVIATPQRFVYASVAKVLSIISLFWKFDIKAENISNNTHLTKTTANFLFKKKTKNTTDNKIDQLFELESPVKQKDTYDVTSQRQLLNKASDENMPFEKSSDKIDKLIKEAQAAIANDDSVL